MRSVVLLGLSTLLLTSPDAATPRRGQGQGHLDLSLRLPDGTECAVSFGPEELSVCARILREGAVQ